MLDSTLKDVVYEYVSENPFIPIYSVVARVLREQISQCRLVYGERLKEIDTAERLGVSRTSVRHAFEILLHEGHVVRQSTGGVTIAPMVRQEFREFVEIRGMLDSWAARLAASRRTEADLQEMREAIAMLMIGDMQNATAADLRFHRSVYIASGNSYIMDICKNFDMEITRSRYISADGVSDSRKRVASEHLGIYDAILKGDAAKASALAEAHTMILLEPALILSEGLVDQPSASGKK